MKIAAYALELPAFDEETFLSKIDNMTINADGSIDVHFFGGKVKRETVTPAMKIQHRRQNLGNKFCFTGKIRCEQCGCSYVHHIQNGGKQKYWHCHVTRKHNKNCPSPKLPDVELESVTAKVMGISKFDEAVFEQTIESIAVLKNGGIEFRFYDGRVTKWQKA